MQCKGRKAHVRETIVGPHTCMVKGKNVVTLSSWSYQFLPQDECCPKWRNGRCVTSPLWSEIFFVSTISFHPFIHIYIYKVSGIINGKREGGKFEPWHLHLWWEHKLGVSEDWRRKGKGCRRSCAVGFCLIAVGGGDTDSGNPWKGAPKLLRPLTAHRVFRPPVRVVHPSILLFFLFPSIPFLLWLVK